jgi:hypothetical protein
MRDTVMFRLKDRRVTTAIGVVLALMIAGVGYFVLDDDSKGAGSNPSGASTDREAAAFDFADCVRGEGIEDYPDPTVEDDGSIVFDHLSSLDASESELAVAQEACHNILDEAEPNGSPSRAPSGVGEPAEGWEEVVPGGDCACADGSDYSFFARDSSPDKVVLLLDGGGACWSASTCAPDGDNEYQTTVDAPNDEGVFNVSDERNPFADYSFVYVPYCTGDVHLGNAVTEYTADLTVHHKGYVNGTAALDYLAETYPDATEVVVMGISAGSVSAAHYAALAADRLPEATVTSIADSSGGYPDQAELNGILTGSQWGTTDALTGALTDVAPEHRSIPGLSVSAAERHPDITFARYDHAYDAEQTSKMSLTGAPTDDLLGLIDANDAQIEKAGVKLHSYTAPGDRHGVVVGDDFYTESVDGVLEWADAVVNRNPVDDVRCADCSTS